MRPRDAADDVSRTASTVLDVGVCIGTNCYIKGSWRLLEGLAAELKRRGLLERCRVKARFCTGQCQDGPNITIGRRIISAVDPDDAAGLINRYLLPALNGELKEEE